MRRKLVSTFGLVTLGVVVALGAASFAPVATAQSDERESTARCTDRTVRGDYGFSIDGTVLAGTPNAFLLRGVAMTHFDGRGNLNQVDFATRNGAPTTADWRPATGSSAINPDCTGTADIIPADGGPVLRLRLVVVDKGREIRTIVVGNATGSVGIRVD